MAGVVPLESRQLHNGAGGGQRDGKGNGPKLQKEQNQEEKQSQTLRQGNLNGSSTAQHVWWLDDKLQMPHYEFDDERVRYEHRFAPFASLITPPIMHYQEFIEMTTNSKDPQTSVHYYMSGADLFHQARSFLEGLPFLDTEVRNLIQFANLSFKSTDAVFF
jgi:N-alpha-acetyltransferase 35, NatC auxiliary subunit